jgi:hypothetical protein
MSSAERVARTGEVRNVYRVLMGRPEGKRPPGRTRRRWVDGIKTDLREIGWGGWSGFSWFRIGSLAGCCDFGDENSGSGSTEFVIKEGKVARSVF